MSVDFGNKDVIQGVIDGLYNEFGNKYTYYKDTVPQDFQVPSFFVRSFSGSYKPLVGNRMLFHTVVTITCFLPEEDETDNFADILARINAALRLTSLIDDLPIITASCSYHIENHELHVEVEYNIHLRIAEEPAPLMEVLCTKGKVKDEERSNG